MLGVKRPPKANYDNGCNEHSRGTKAPAFHLAFDRDVKQAYQRKRKSLGQEKKLMISTIARDWESKCVLQ